MPEVKVTNIVKFYTLLLLYEKSKHGYEIIKEISEKIGKKVSAGEIYPFLKILQKNHYVMVEETGEREKKVYRLTQDGKNFVRKMLNRFGNLIDIAVEPLLTKCAHCGCEVYRGGHKEIVKGKKLIFCCCYCAKSYKK